MHTQRCDRGAILKVMDDDRAFFLSDFFKALGDSGRIKILYLLKDKEICVQHLSEELNMTQSSVSHQLRILRDQRLVRFIKDGKKIYYTLADEHVSEIIELGIIHLNEREK